MSRTPVPSKKPVSLSCMINSLAVATTSTKFPLSVVINVCFVVYLEIVKVHLEIVKVHLEIVKVYLKLVKAKNRLGYTRFPWQAVSVERKNLWPLAPPAVLGGARDHTEICVLNVCRPGILDWVLWQGEPRKA
eukprot:g25087.t1